MTKQMKQESHSVNYALLMGSLDDAIEYLQELKDIHGNSCLGLHIDYDSLEYVIEREETDEEYEWRLEREEHARQLERKKIQDSWQKQLDEAEFNRLKRKLGL